MKTLIRCSSSLPVALSVLGWSAAASAQGLGDDGDFTIGVERVFGLYTMHIEQELPGPVDLERDPGSFGFMFQSAPDSPLVVPRVGFDYFIIPQLSLGGSLALASYDPDDDDDDDDEVSTFLFAPRVGYAIEFNASWGVWLRGGFSYYSQGFANDTSRNLLALSGEGAFYYLPAPNVGFTLSPLFDLGLTGEVENDDADQDYTERVFALMLGMFARF